jgi:2,3,4,5-tetrahydropyridine-2-carboxylate N-succinyltransferase
MAGDERQGAQRAALRTEIERCWEARADPGPIDAAGRQAVIEAMELLDAGELRVAEIDPVEGSVVVHEWLRRAIQLWFTAGELAVERVGPFEYVDRVALKRGLLDAGVRVVPGAVVRFGAFVGRGAILMPSFVNVGAYVGSSTMVDTWATVGSCAQIGSGVHLSGGVGIGGVLEPPGAVPVVIEDDVLVGSRCVVTQGARIGRGAVLGEGAILNPGIPVVDAASGEEISRGVVPPFAVAVGASRRRSFAGGEFFLPCVLVLRYLEDGERHDKAELNAILRHHGVSM